METKGIPSNHMNRFAKLSLKKNSYKQENEFKNLHCNSDVCILDDSFDRLRLDLPKNIQSSQKICSPIVILDSSLDESLPKVSFDSKKSNKNEYLKTPSKMGNISFNCSKEEIDVSLPSINGWSPAQPIMCATPKQNPIPSTPKDIANESLNHCSIKTIQKSQKKLLSDLYGEVWKSIPTLFKTISHSKGNINECAKRLNFEDDDEKENIRFHIKKNKELYLDMENKKRDITDTEKKKKKLYTEKIPCTPEPKTLTNIKSTGKKKIVKGMSITELVEGMSNDIEVLTKKVENVSVCNKVNIGTVQVGRLSFIASLADGVQSWQCHTEAIQYKDNFKTLKEQLTRRLFKEFNSCVFNNALDHDLPIIWNSKFRCTAGTATNHSRKNANGDRIRSSSIKLSTKVVDTPQRLRDTLIHEMCHVATWLIDGELRAGHGPLWKKWAARSLKVFPELGEIKRCHSMAIHFKYTYKCTKCGYSFQRHSKSIDITKKFCGYCRGTFEIIVNKKTKDGVVSTPARRGGVNDFAQYVKENYATAKEGKTHAQVMKILGEQFSAKKNKL